MSKMSELDMILSDVLLCIEVDHLTFSEAMTRLYQLYPDTTDVESEFIRSMLKRSYDNVTK